MRGCFLFCVKLWQLLLRLRNETTKAFISLEKEEMHFETAIQ